MFQRIKGTQDFIDLSLYNYIVDMAKKHLATYHFTEISTPIIEPLDLFKRSLGQETDVVSKEMFVINTGPEGEGICLRPEATASVVRAFVENGIAHTPWKVFTYGPMFRHERPQKGRYRQFNQINIEVIGSSSISEDVQLIKMLDRFFHEKLHINDYALLINFLGCSDDRVAYREKLKKYLESVSSKICSTCQHRATTNIMRIFDCKNPECQELYQKAPFITDHLCSSCQGEWNTIQKQLSLLSVSYAIRPTLVRGLDYYNKTVFEFTSSSLGSQSTFCGGGRYDQLVAQVGSKEDQPSVGAGMGIERLMMILEPIMNKLNLPQPPALYLVIPMSSEQEMLALLIADTLQAHNLATDVILGGESMKSMMRKANKMAATYCLIIGSDEQEKKEVTVKNMINGESVRMAQTALIHYFTGK